MKHEELYTFLSPLSCLFSYLLFFFYVFVLFFLLASIKTKKECWFVCFGVFLLSVFWFFERRKANVFYVYPLVHFSMLKRMIKSLVLSSFRNKTGDLSSFSSIIWFLRKFQWLPKRASFITATTVFSSSIKPKWMHIFIKKSSTIFRGSDNSS